MNRRNRLLYYISWAIRQINLVILVGPACLHAIAFLVVLVFVWATFRSDIYLFTSKLIPLFIGWGVGLIMHISATLLIILDTLRLRQQAHASWYTDMNTLAGITEFKHSGAVRLGPDGEMVFEEEGYDAAQQDSARESVRKQAAVVRPDVVRTDTEPEKPEISQ